MLRKLNRFNFMQNSKMMNNKIFNIHNLIILSFIGLWGSLGSDPYDFLKWFESTKNIRINFLNIELVNFLRSIFPYLFFFSSLIYILRNNIYNYQNKIVNIFLLIYIFQFLSTFLSNYSIISDFEDMISHIGRYHWIISGFCVIFLFIIADKLSRKSINILFYISVIFLFIIVIFFSSKIIYDFYNSTENEAIYHLSVWRDSAIFLNHEIPRLTGLSRSIIFLYIFILFVEEFNLKINVYLTSFILIFFGSLIIFFQTKFSIGALILIHIVHLYFFKNKTKGLITIILLIILQFFVFYSLSSMRLLLQVNNNQDEIITDGTKVIQENPTNIIENQDNNAEVKKPKIQHFRNFSYDQMSGFEYFNHTIFSGRAALWKSFSNDIKERPLIGYGSMSDRVLYFNRKKSDGRFQINPISNAYLYSLISGGLISLFLLIYAWYLIGRKIINSLKISNLKNKIPNLLIGIIFLRTFVENSMMIFGIDFILLFNCIYLLRRK